MLDNEVDEGEPQAKWQRTTKGKGGRGGRGAGGGNKGGRKGGAEGGGITRGAGRGKGGGKLSGKGAKAALKAKEIMARMRRMQGLSSSESGAAEPNAEGTGA